MPWLVWGSWSRGARDNRVLRRIELTAIKPQEELLEPRAILTAPYQHQTNETNQEIQKILHLESTER